MFAPRAPIFCLSVFCLVSQICIPTRVDSLRVPELASYKLEGAPFDEFTPKGLAQRQKRFGKTTNEHLELENFYRPASNDVKGRRFKEEEEEADENDGHIAPGSCQMVPIVHLLKHPGCNLKAISSFACSGACLSYVQVSGPLSTSNLRLFFLTH